MTPQNKLIENWALSKGFKTPYETAVSFEYQGYNLSVGFVKKTGGILLSAPVKDTTIAEDTLEFLRSNLRGQGNLAFDSANNTLQLSLSTPKDVDFYRFMDRAIVAFAAVLANKNIATRTSCFYCGLEDTDSSVELPQALILPAHSKCKAAGIQTVEGKKNTATKNSKGVSLGALGAILFGLIGAVPVFLLLVFGNAFASLFFVLIPIFILLGYKLFRGKSSLSIRILTVFLSFAIALTAYIIALYYSFYVNEYKGYKLAEQVAVGTTTLEDAQKKITDIDYYIEHYPSLISLMDLQGIGKKVTFTNYVKANPFSKSYSFSFVDYLDFYTNPNWLKLHTPSAIYIFLFTSVGIVFVWLYAGRAIQGRRAPATLPKGKGSPPIQKPDSMAEEPLHIDPPAPNITKPAPTTTEEASVNSSPFIFESNPPPVVPKGEVFIPPTHQEPLPLELDPSVPSWAYGAEPPAPTTEQSATPEKKATLPPYTESQPTSGVKDSLSTPLTDELFGNLPDLTTHQPASTDFETLFADILPKKEDEKTP